MSYVMYDVMLIVVPLTIEYTQFISSFSSEPNSDLNTQADIKQSNPSFRAFIKMTQPCFVTYKMFFMFLVFFLLN